MDAVMAPTPPAHSGHSISERSATEPAGTSPGPSHGGDCEVAEGPLGPEAPNPMGMAATSSQSASSHIASPTASFGTANGQSSLSESKKRKADDGEKNGASTPATSSGEPETKKRKPSSTLDGADNTTVHFPDEMEFLDWVRRHDKATTRDLIAHFQPFIQTREQLETFRLFAEKLAFDEDDFMVIRRSHCVKKSPSRSGTGKAKTVQAEQAKPAPTPQTTQPVKPYSAIPPSVYVSLGRGAPLYWTVNHEGRVKGEVHPLRNERTLEDLKNEAEEEELWKNLARDEIEAARAEELARLKRTKEKKLAQIAVRREMPKMMDQQERAQTKVSTRNIQDQNSRPAVSSTGNFQKIDGLLSIQQRSKYVRRLIDGRSNLIQMKPSVLWEVRYLEALNGLTPNPRMDFADAFFELKKLFGDPIEVFCNNRAAVYWDAFPQYARPQGPLPEGQYRDEERDLFWVCSGGDVGEDVEEDVKRIFG